MEFMSYNGGFMHRNNKIDPHPTGAKPIGESISAKGYQKEYKGRKIKEPSYKELCEQWERILRED
jgi:hypothetical protein